MFALAIILMIVLPSLSFLFFSVLAIVVSPWFVVLALGSLALFLFFLLKKFRASVKADGRLVVERNGVPRVLGPGRYWIRPWVDERRRYIRTCIYTRELDVTGKITFGPAQAAFRGATAYLRLIGNFAAGVADPFLEPYDDDEHRNEHPVFRATYFIGDWKVAARNVIQDALTSTNIVLRSQGNQQQILQRGLPIPIADISQEAAIRLERWGLCGEITLHIVQD